MKKRVMLSLIAALGLAGCYGKRLAKIETTQEALVKHANQQNAINQKLSDDVKLIGGVLYQHANNAEIHMSTATVNAMIHPKPVKKRYVK